MGRSYCMCIPHEPEMGSPVRRLDDYGHAPFITTVNEDPQQVEARIRLMFSQAGRLLRGATDH